MDERPPVFRIFLDALDIAVPKKALFGGQYYEKSTVAVLSAFLYARGAMLGLAFTDLGLTTAERRDELVGLLGTGSPAAFWSFVQHQVQRRGLPDAEHSGGLQHAFLASEYPELFGTEALVRNRTSPNAIANEARRRVKADLGLLTTWSKSFAEGVGTAVLLPDLMREHLEQDYAPADADEWQDAIDAGLHLPDEVPQMDLDADIRDALGAVAAFAAVYYPELVARW